MFWQIISTIAIVYTVVDVVAVVIIVRRIGYNEACARMRAFFIE